ncbi:response regulator transcription factor [Massilia sp. TW-1]|uniref:Response regulator transcription factor n=1 Tax=Telluria antibiotica TaxID=2717319 RepID=A0ABX0PIT8_9BURK|nr:response regulator transcription factor [Telluria antibiotica]NIA57352.1 response regulator transcription factor [Telluria antibiotica]
MIRILIADDHAIVRGGLKHLFAMVQDIDVAGEAVNGAQALEFLRHTPVDLVLLDLTMPGMSGTDLIARIRSVFPDLAILVLSMRNEPQIVRQVFKVGASGYLTKDSEPEMLVAAIRKTVASGRFIDPALAEQLVFDVAQPGATPPHEQLSDREAQIFALLARGRSVNDIAAELMISNKTVSTHKAHLMQKMNFMNHTDLVRYAILHGLVE